MDDDELKRRRDVWSALSELFLDTETRWFLPRIALVLARSGYRRSELQRIWRYEMIPECAWNVLSVAGEWIALPLDESKLVQRATTRPGILSRLSWLVPSSTLGFRQTLELQDRLEPIVERERDRLGSVWSAFAHAYLEEKLEDVLFLDKEMRSLRESGLTPSRCSATFEADFRPVYRELLQRGEKRSESARAANVTELIERSFGQE